MTTMEKPRIELVKELLSEGLSVKEIAKRVDLPRITVRRECVLELVHQGYETRYIVDRLDSSRSVIISDRRALGISASSGGSSQEHSRERQEAVNARRKQIKKLYEQGLSIYEMSTRLNISHHTIKKDHYALGLKPRQKSGIELTRDDLFEEFKWLVEGGDPSSTAGRRLGLTKTRTVELCKELGIEYI